jgi:hypothetical protein
MKIVVFCYSRGMEQSTINSIQEALLPLTQALGEGAAYSWETLVQGILTEGIISAVILTVTFLIFIPTFLISAYLYDWERDAGGALVPVVLVSGGASFLWMMVATFEIYNLMLKIMNPEYMALKYLLGIAGIN